MEKIHHQEPEEQKAPLTEEQKVEQGRITYAKNMLQMQLALRKGFDGSSEEANPEHFFDKYKEAFGKMIEANPGVVEDFYTSTEDFDMQIKRVEDLMETYVPTYLKQ
jgi:hypothetical protein